MSQQPQRETFMAFDDEGRPWGVITQLSQVGNPTNMQSNLSDISDPTRRDFAEYLVGECNLTAATAFTYETAFRRIEQFFGGRVVTGLSVDDIRAFLRSSGFHPSTKNATLVAIKALHRWGLVERHPWASSQVGGLRGPKQVRNPKPSLAADDVGRLLRSLRTATEYRVVMLGLFAGCRVSEAARIGEREWLNDKFRFEGKGRKVREVPIHPALQDVRSKILSKTPSADTLKHVCRSLSFVTGIDFTSHTLRRTFAVTLSEAGVPREVIGALLGHAPATVTETYAPVRWQEKFDAIQHLDVMESFKYRLK